MLIGRFALLASYVSVVGPACMAIAGGPASAGYAAVCALPMTVLAVDLIAWYRPSPSVHIILLITLLDALPFKLLCGYELMIRRLLFSITFGAEIYYAVKGGNKTVVPPRHVDEEYKVGRNGVQQQENGGHQNDGGLRY